MPYSGINDPKLPSYVKKVSDELKSGWVAVFNKAYETDGETKAMLMANAWLKKQLPTREKFVKRSAVELTLVDTGTGFIKRSDNGDDYVTFVLNSTQPHKDGKQFSEEMLMEWAEYINNNPTLVGDVDHLLYDKILGSDMTDEQARSALKSKKGIAKMVQAIYEKGKLWVRAVIDKRYRKIIEKSKGVSAEAFINKYDNNVAKSGELLGFTFNVNTNPADYNAVLA